MTLRRILAIATFGAAAYYGILGVRILLEGADAYAKLVAIVYCGGSVAGTLIALALGKNRTRGRSREEADSAVGSLKNTLVVLIAVVLGLGCLYFAAEGLFTGSIATLSRRGSRSLPLSFSLHPVQFLGLLAFWSAVGMACLWLSWRMIRRDRPQ